MSIEAAIQGYTNAVLDNTTAIRELIAKLSAGVPITTVSEKAVEVVKAVPAPTTKPATAKAEAKKQEAAAAAATASSPSSVEPQTTAQAAVAPATTTPTEIDYEQVRAKVVELSKEKGRDPTVALLARFGVKTGKDLTADQYADFIKDADRVLAGEYNPEEAELA